MVLPTLPEFSLQGKVAVVTGGGRYENKQKKVEYNN
jgi:hypothetical protein